MVSPMTRKKGFSSVRRETPIVGFIVLLLSLDLFSVPLQPARKMKNNKVVPARKHFMS
jgi:hypothetical protein